MNASCWPADLRSKDPSHILKDDCVRVLRLFYERSAEGKHPIVFHDEHEDGDMIDVADNRALQHYIKLQESGPPILRADMQELESANSSDHSKLTNPLEPPVTTPLAQAPDEIVPMDTSSVPTLTKTDSTGVSKPRKSTETKKRPSRPKKVKSKKANIVSPIEQMANSEPSPSKVAVRPLPRYGEYAALEARGPPAVPSLIDVIRGLEAQTPDIFAPYNSRQPSAATLRSDEGLELKHESPAATNFDTMMEAEPTNMNWELSVSAVPVQTIPATPNKRLRSLPPPTPGRRTRHTDPERTQTRAMAASGVRGRA